MYLRTYLNLLFITLFVQNWCPVSVKICIAFCTFFIYLLTLVPFPASLSPEACIDQVLLVETSENRIVSILYIFCSAWPQSR